ncbi:protein translocase subunit SecF|uniref:Protein-export membrane protein SecF n=1 Tax=Dendrosporobacter quercicolus TaxID=146817 RepID=A0A1G9KQ37_9FIRM|nr:protein translocase subunit SecF [Dendrosporobacter quercicolus]NSL46475.1 protein translocase subunit SecF [Dendrosporobacter quercicolus DSM 1736]SDL51940.1 preprotein translocase subunit SecF [Dendrosporobacter quercicolus]
MNFDFIGKRKWWFSFSALIIITGFISMAVQGFNLGIDFTGGNLLDLRFTRPVTVTEVREALKEHHFERSTIQLAAEGQTDAAPNVFIRTTMLSEEDRLAVLADLKQKVGDFEVLRIEQVGATIGSELTRQAILALVLSWALMIAYISYRFEFKFAIAGIIGLVHVVLVVLGAFSLLQKEIDASFVAALLTIVGYSINDTIVIFDRIRENLKAYRKSEGLEHLVNKSILQTMTRSIYTVLTVLFAAGSLYFFGGDTTRDFSLALLIGFTVGAYSSIFIASPVWVMLRQAEERKRLAGKTNPAK